MEEPGGWVGPRQPQRNGLFVHHAWQATGTDQHPIMDPLAPGVGTVHKRMQLHGRVDVGEAPDRVRVQLKDVLPGGGGCT